MNPEPQILQLQPQLPPPPNPFPHANTPDPNPPANNPSPFNYTHRGNGKIARLPKSIRDQVNEMLLDGLSYPDIIAHLGVPGKDLKPGHLCEWKKRGYQDWLQQREWLEQLSTKSEFSTAVLAAPDTASLHEAGLRIAAAQMLDQLARFAASAPDPTPQPEKFARLVNALARLTREALSFRKYHDASARECDRQLKHLPPDRALTDNDHDLFLKKVEEFFRLKLLRPIPPSLHPQPNISDNAEPDSP